MTISSTTNRVSYSGNGVTTSFSFPYYFLSAADLKVIVKDNTTGAETLKVLTTDYSVSGAGSGSGGSITMVSAPASTETLVVYRDPLAKQETDFLDNDELPAETLEQSFDKLTMISQRLADRMNRAITLPEAFTASFDTKLPAAMTADAVLKIKSDGSGFEMGPTATEVSDAQTYAANAAASASAASGSATAAANSATAAAASATAAAASETNAAASEGAAATSEANASASESAAAGSATAAAASAGAASTSATNAANSATAAAASETAAAGSATAAAGSATNAANSATAAAASETNAATSETNAASSAAAAAAVSVKRFLGTVAADGSTLTYSVDVSGQTITDARDSIWQLRGLAADDYEILAVALSTPDASTVAITTDVALPAGNYKLIGIQ